MTIHAYTEPGNSLPAYINISERVSNPGDVIVTVRGSGENSGSTIILGREHLRKLADDVQSFLVVEGEKTRAALVDLNPERPTIGLSEDGSSIVGTGVTGQAFSIALTDDEQQFLKERMAARGATVVNEPAPAPAGGSMITFADFVQYGRDNGGNMVNGMPWSFQYLGHPVTHENDQCYLVGGVNQLRFTPDDVLRTNSMGELSVEPMAKATPLIPRTKSA